MPLGILAAVMFAVGFWCGGRRRAREPDTKIEGETEGFTGSIRNDRNFVHEVSASTVARIELPSPS